jgi:beta-lactamase class D
MKYFKKYLTYSIIGINIISIFISCSISNIIETNKFKTKEFKVSPKHFAELDGCFLAFDLKTKKLVANFGKIRCSQLYEPCSTFKLPLAIMAFESGILKDESTSYQWDGKKRFIDSWNADQTASSWMKNSVVWYSQKITPLLGKEKIQNYLQKFNYGNQDFSAGLTGAWLTITKNDSDKSKGSLKITAYEQLEFLKHFWNEDLSVSSESISKTKKIIYLESSPSGFKLHGKTGSGYLKNLKGDFGWFVGHVEGNGKEYLFVTTFTRDEKSSDSRFPGLLAKDLTKEILKDNFAW